MGTRTNINLRSVRKMAAKYNATIDDVIYGRTHTIVHLIAEDGHRVRLSLSLSKINSFKQEGWVRQALTRPQRPIGNKNAAIGGENGGGSKN